MGKGADASASVPVLPFLKRAGSSFTGLSGLADLRTDLETLGRLWFSTKAGDCHAERLESFYGAQAATYDKFREKFLWGRRPMLAACAARLRQNSDLVWVDLGGGTGENVQMMFDNLPADQFKAIYVVDLCHSLCEEAKRKAAERGWKNVHVIEADACTWTPPGGVKADLVTFSYSLSMIPPFHEAVENAYSMMSDAGLLGIADFFVSGKYDTPMRQMSWVRRFFWRATFDIDNIDIGPERRAYLESRLERVWEVNKQGSIPFVPYLRAPYYVWIGRKWADEGKGVVHHEQCVEAPPLFPPTFLYTQSWEDPEPDMKVMNISADDVCLTLTSGGCNTLNLLLHGAKEVVSVDCNPAQSALLELKAVALQQLDYEDVWQMFGEGRHPRIKQLFEQRLAPFLSQKAHAFWSDRLWYFKQGLYYQGGMGKLCWVMQTLFTMLGLGQTVRKLCTAPTLEEQRKIFHSIALVAFMMRGPKMLAYMFSKTVRFLLFNRVVLWFGGGVPMKQYKLIKDDGVPIEQYIFRTAAGVVEHSHLRKDNYFYYNCLMGRFARDNCPSYLKPQSAAQLKGGLLDRLVISTRFFMDELTARTYSKVILMDHVDWLDLEVAESVAAALAVHVRPGGVVIWRSASLNPPYTKLIEAAGFDVRCLQRVDEGYMDRVNMYASFFIATRQGKDKKL